MAYGEKEFAEWRWKINQWQKSYLSITKWCKENNESYDKFQYWRLKLNLREDRSIRNSVMKIFPEASQFYLYINPLDVSKSFDFLRRIIDMSFPETTNGKYFVFLGTRKRTIKAYYYYPDSEMFWFKQLNRGTFLFDHTVKLLPKKGDFYALL